jgi:predicted lipid-binding transport protein (Tim44 family)
MQPAYAGPAAYAGAPAEAASSVAPPPSGLTSAPTDLERGLDHIGQMDPAFDPHRLAADARELFSAVQGALGARDMRALAARLTPRMYAELTAHCDRLRAARRTNRVEAIAIQRAEVSEAWQESGHDYVTVYLAGSLMDYTVDDASGAVVEGQRAPQAFEEYWTFARPVGPQAWKLSAIQTA